MTLNEWLNETWTGRRVYVVLLATANLFLFGYVVFDILKKIGVLP